MLNYLNNNLVLINEIQKIYRNGINVKLLIEQLKNGKILNYSTIDYSRFRVFLDSCMLLQNKEKLNIYLNNGFSFKEYLSCAKTDEDFRSYIQNINEFPFIPNLSDMCLFYSLDGKTKNPWEQISIIRNAMAHMQYGGFLFIENDCFLIGFYLYNKGKGVKKNYGIVLEPVFHHFIQSFFSNYSYGLLYKYGFFSKYSLEKEKIIDDYLFYEITSNYDCVEIYNGYNNSIISDLAFIKDPYEKIRFILKNREKLRIKKVNVNEIIKKKTYKKFIKKYKLINDYECIYGTKLLLDFETEFSNFLVHIVQLNEVLYEYSLIDSGDDIRQEYLSKFEEKLWELAEDEHKKLSFRIGFTILKAINFSLRIEDDDYIKLDYEKVDVSKFNYDKSALQCYTERNNLLEDNLHKYIIEKMRNALMHGHISLSLNKKGEVIFNFCDVYHKRKECLWILLHDLELFLSQESLYCDIPKYTPLFSFSKD